MRALLFKLLLPLVGFIGLVQPLYGLCIYIGFNILRPEMFFWGSHSANLIFKVSLISSFVGFLRLQPNSRSIITYREFWILLFIWAASAISLLMADHIFEPKAWYYSIELLKLWILGCLILGVACNGKDLLKVQYVVMGAISILSLWGIEQHFLGNSRLEGMGGSAYGDSNGVAAAGVLYFPIALNNAITAKNKKWKCLWFLSAALIAGLIIFTQSRGGFLGLIASVAYLFLRARKKKTLVVVCVLAALVSSPFLAQEYTKRLETITAEGEDRDFSSGSRLVLWNAGVLMFLDHPVFGVGLLNFAKTKGPYKQALSGKFDQELLDYSFRGYKVGHGTYFTQLMAEGGLLLTIPYFLLIGGFVFGALRVRKRRPEDEDVELADLLAGMEAGVIGHCLSIMFINALFFYFLPVQLVIGGQIIRVLNEKSISGETQS